MILSSRPSLHLEDRYLTKTVHLIDSDGIKRVVRFAGSLYLSLSF